MEPVDFPNAFDLAVQRAARTVLVWGVVLGSYSFVALEAGLPLPGWAPAAGL